MSESYKKRDTEEVVEEQTLVKETNGTRIVAKASESMRLSPGWKRTNKSDDESNGKDGVLDHNDLDLNPPNDRMKFLYVTMVLHGIGVLMPWNMFLNANEYFQDVKLKDNLYFKSNYMFYLTLTAQLPNLFFNWFNVFFSTGGDIGKRIVWGLVVEAVIFLFTIGMAMADTENQTTLFFWVTMGSVFLLNTANGIYQNSIYGMAAKLPGKYTGAIVLGSNLSGIIATIIGMITRGITKNYTSAAIYYFITALFVILACIDTYFSLPLNKYFRYHERLEKKQQIKTEISSRKEKIPFLMIIKQCWLQLLCVFLLFFVTLTIFPGIQMNILRQEDSTFFIDSKKYVNFMCFLSFNITAFLGSLLATLVQWPSKKYLIVPISLRLLYIPAFMFFCNYAPPDFVRHLPILYHNDWVYAILSLTMGFSSGYFSSLAMMNCGKCVEPRYATVAGKLAGAALSSGIFAGILTSMGIQKVMFSPK
ncbi:hypothetical protein HCN44_005722 [Aphidius gifuensis]|uniref:Equilibrative nucleoside transporter n=1 Tax=Aphidius gifuensis TaxID=684658 RepID=A0A834XY28_APHGI|nr:equilibrative nucleoside transporter 1-like [Aphidius gifuensis]XP_044008688.1 equilibrative nucleoside transporter 1-like [Aphidius gifuensis]KAF7992941.1 hypothetical protein HCN44_005722 [Aphidius gifuensis]